MNSSIESLVASIRREFPVAPLLPKSIHIAYAQGDAWSVQRINNILNHRPWDQVTFDELLACGADELKSYLSLQAFSYYIPALLVGVLLNLTPRTRLHEVSILMLMPDSSEFVDVWEYFGDGLFADWGTPNFPESSNGLIEKSSYIHRSFSFAQRDCLARYVEIVEFCDTSELNIEFSKLLGKFAKFWRTG